MACETDSVYVHAPFCVRRCFYCDFAVQVRRTGDADAWLGAVAGELQGIGAEGVFVLADRLQTLYVGGGTPSLLGADAMAGLAAVLGPERLAEPALEWTVEANPESFSPDVAGGWRRAGVNRVSLGVQTFHDEALRWMGRMHGPAGAVTAVETARRAGFDNFSVDLIFGLPAHVGRSWTDDLAAALDLDPPHVSLYGLSVEAGTPLGRAVREGREPAVDDDRYSEEFLEAAETLTAAGYEHYEVSNFARPGLRSRHNAVYWSGRPYLGLGNGAHSFAPPLRRWNLREWDAYSNVATKGALATEDAETLDDPALRMEGIWLGLRTSDGLSLAGMPDSARRRVSGWVGQGWAVVSDERVRLTASGWLLLDRLSVELDGACA